MPSLVTERLRLVPVTLEAIEAVLDHDKERAEALVGAKFPPQWPNDDLVALGFPYSREALRADPERRLWGDSLALLRDEPRVVGSVVFHGYPGDGIAEVAYSVEECSRRQGLAIEATRACVEWALQQDGIHAVQATTFPWHVASLGVIKRLGMVHVDTREHDTLGELLVFERRRGT
ncbi:MAG TPA: GNAT family N-acetyltransferase [Kofleriaceae bacterium]|nr:GNAT family N-acetyltransferase [Kofleriaceae bacterium]